LIPTNRERRLPGRGKEGIILAKEEILAGKGVSHDE
jgi:hypothetical protein